MSKIRKATGQRIGQLIYNAIDRHDLKEMESMQTVKEFQDNFHSRLFYISDKDLIKIVQAYIKTLEVK